MAIGERDKQDVSHHPESHGEKPYGVPGVRFIEVRGATSLTPAEKHLDSSDVMAAIEDLHKDNKGLLMEPTEKGVFLRVFHSKKAAIETAAVLGAGGVAVATGAILLLKSEKSWRVIKEIPHPHFWLPRKK